MSRSSAGHRRPGRTRGVCLTVLLAVAMVAALAPGTPAKASAVAQVNTHTAATFNIQYGNRWQTAVYPLAKQVEVLALQEVRDEDPDQPNAEPADGRVVRRETQVRTPGATYTVQRFRWVNCARQWSTEPDRYCVIYKLRTQGANRSLALVVNQPTDQVDAVNVVPPQAVGARLEPDAKPALGIRLTDGTWFYCVHARNRVGRTQANDAPFLLDAISRASGAHWAVMGDFNRTPDSLPADPSGLRKIIRSGQFTHPRRGPTSELDYMVAQGIATPHQYSAFRLRYMEESDHFPVGFWNSARPDHDITCEGDLLRGGRDQCALPRPPAVVSMGDSYTSGEAGRWAGNAATHAQGTAWGTDRAAVGCAGEDSCEHDPGQVYGETSYAPGGNRCDRSDVAPVMSAAHPGVDSWQHFNIACSGATTDEITHPYAEKGETAQAEQLAYIATHYRVRMIAVTIGGNDLKFKDIAESCARRYLLGFVAYCKNAWGDLRGELDDVGRKVTGALSAIQDTMGRAGYGRGDYRLVVQSYPAPLPAGGDYRYPETYGRYSSGGCPFYDTDSDWARQTLVGGLRSRLRTAALSTGATFLDVSDAFAGHELCSKVSRQATGENSLKNPLDSQAAEWFRWIPYLLFEGGPWRSQGDQQEALHPNAFGQQALGACLTRLGDLLTTSSATDFTCRNDGRNGTGGMSVRTAYLLDD